MVGGCPGKSLGKPFLPKIGVQQKIKQIANLIMDDVAKGNIEVGAAYIKKQAKMDGNIEKESDYIRKSMGVPYDIEDFIERGFW